MKILLLSPPNNLLTSEGLSINIGNETVAYPPLGLLYIASYLLLNTRNEVEIIDAQNSKFTINSLKEKIIKYRPHIIGIYVSTFNILDSIFVAKTIKQINSNIYISLGGPYLTVFPEETIIFPEVDFVVVGEGEITFKELVDALENGGELSRIKGLIFKEEGKIIRNDPREFIKDLDKLPFPARHLVKSYNYKSVFSGDKPITGIITSRGCHYKCIFCSRQHLGELVRARSPENIIKEVKECLDMGIEQIIFYDENFNFSKLRTLRICDMIMNENLNFKWQIKTRVDLIDENLLIKLKQAGCERIHYGAESANESVLKILKKGINTAQIKEALYLTKKIGIKTLFYFLIGSPTETKREIIETIKFAISLNPDYVHFSIATPFPGTELYAMGLEKAIFNDYWREFAIKPHPDFRPRFFVEKNTEKELAYLLKYAYRRFYFRPSYLLRHILMNSGPEELRLKLKFALKLFKYTLKN